MRNKKTITIIGAGPAGLSAAITAKREAILNNIDIDIIILEQNDRIGRKLAATGNGRCNLSNINMSSNFYNKEVKLLNNNFFNKQAVNNIIKFFNSLGLLTKTDDEGRIYPYTLQALSVIECLKLELDKLNITVTTNFKTSTITKTNHEYIITSDTDEKVRTDKIIFATGGLAHPNLGSNKSGYDLLKSLGHDITRLEPSLSSLKIKDYSPSLKGIRWRCDVKLTENKKIICENSGEVQFTEYGLSGIVIMQLSRYVSDLKNQSVILDLMPEYSPNDILSIITYAYDNSTDPENLLLGLININLGKYLIKQSDFNVKNKKEILKKVASLIKNLKFDILNKMSYENAQITKGGINLYNINPDTFESSLKKDIYIIGEVLNVDGDCGGYNLHFAFNSGITAGKSILKN